MKIYKPDEINIDTIKYGNSRKITLKNNSNVFFVPMVIHENNPILIQLPSIILNTNYKKDNLIIPLKCVNNYKTQTLVNLLNNIDDKIITDFTKNANTWCTLQKILDIEYKAIVIDDDDISTIRLQFDDIMSDTHHVKLFDENCNLVRIDDFEYGNYLTKNTTVQIIIEIRGLIIDINDSDNQIYVFVRTHQIKFSKDKEINFTLEDYSFLESEHSEIESATENDSSDNEYNSSS